MTNYKFNNAVFFVYYMLEEDCIITFIARKFLNLNLCKFEEMEF